MSFATQLRIRMKLPKMRVWQNRFWDHAIRDEDDMNRHLDYIHYNPVMHGLTNDPFSYEHSSARSFLQQGYYTEEWGSNDELVFTGEFGE